MRSIHSIISYFILLAGTFITSNTLGFELNLEKGSRLMIILPTNFPKNEGLQKQYFQEVDRLERGEFGLVRHGMLSVENSLTNLSTNPKVIALMSFPSTEHENAFMDQPDWSSIKTSRKIIWQELIVNTISMPAYANWEFDPQHIYTFEFIWLASDQDIGDLGFYYKGQNLGNLSGDIYESHHNGDSPPSFISINKWDSNEQLELALNSGKYRSYLQKIGPFVKRHEIYQARPQPVGQ